MCERESCKVKIDQHEPQETKVPLVVTMNQCTVWFTLVFLVVASLAGVLVHFGH